MWNWLNSNAGAVQAICAAIYVLVTAVLVLITARYVRLTNTLAHAAVAQLEAQDRAAKARRRELQALANFLLVALQSLPDPARRQRPETRIKWENDFNFGRFQTLAAEVGPSQNKAAALVVSEMAWFAERANSTPGWPEDKYWGFFSSEEWNNRLIATRRALETVLKEPQEA